MLVANGSQGVLKRYERLFIEFRGGTLGGIGEIKLGGC